MWRKPRTRLAGGMGYAGYAGSSDSQNQTSRLNSQVSDGLRGFNQLNADAVRNACVRLRRFTANRTYGATETDANRVGTISSA